MSESVVDLGSFKPGITNRRPVSRMDDVQAGGERVHWLLGADNVDLNNEGFLSRRKGFSQKLAGHAHSLWNDGNTMLVVLNGDLVKLDHAMQPTVLLAGIGRFPVSYTTTTDGGIYFTNGSVIKRINPRFEVEDICPPTPAGVDVEVISGGLPAGRYHYTATAQDGGIESAPLTTRSMTVPDNSGLRFTVRGATHTAQVYVSSANGEVLNLAGSGNSVTVLMPVYDTKRCDTLLTKPMPQGQIVRNYLGRLLVAKGNVLWMSMPYHYALCRPNQDFMQFPERITVVEVTDGGVYICADKTYWFSDVESGLKAVTPFGGVFGTGVSSPKRDEVFWHSENGLIMGDNKGEVVQAQEPVTMGDASSGASLYRQQDGNEHVLTTRGSPEVVRAGMSSYMSAEVVKKGATP